MEPYGKAARPLGRKAFVKSLNRHAEQDPHDRGERQPRRTDPAHRHYAFLRLAPRPICLATSWRRLV